MKKQQKRETKSPMWNPVTVGEKLEGVFTRIVHGSFTDGKPSLSFQLDTGNILVNASIAQVLTKEVFTSLKSGKTKMRFEFDGFLPSKKKGWNPTKLFSVHVDGKKLQSSFGQTADWKDVQSYIESLSKKK